MRSRSKPAFTILELLAAVAVFSLILLVVLSVVGQTTTVWRRAADKVESFQGARAAFEMLTRNLSQATLNSYLDYDVPDRPTRYLRKSELKFLITPAATIQDAAENSGQAVFFQAPASRTTKPLEFGGMESLLNTCGYFVAFDDDSATKPSFVKADARYRYRLMQVIVPAERNAIYSESANQWVNDALAHALPAADNIIALILRAQEPGAVPPDLTTAFTYDSAAPIAGVQAKTSHQLPPVVQVTMVAIDETSAKKLENNGTAPAAITSALAGKFRSTASYETDLEALESALNSANPPIGYRIFSSAVPLRESKWSQ